MIAKPVNPANRVNPVKKSIFVIRYSLLIIHC
jgi:hypothetical protein